MRAVYAPPCSCVGMAGFHEPSCAYFDSAHDPPSMASPGYRGAVLRFQTVPPDSPFAEGADDDPDAPGYWRGELGFPWDEYDLRPDVDGPDWSDDR